VIVRSLAHVYYNNVERLSLSVLVSCSLDSQYAKQSYNDNKLRSKTKSCDIMKSVCVLLKQFSRIWHVPGHIRRRYVSILLSMGIRRTCRNRQPLL
jgi:hypothetical protein